MGLKGKFSLGAVNVLLVAYILNTYWNRDSPIVTLNSGEKLLGRIALSREGRDIYEYLGIPYAQPPVGDLRFKSPRPFERWTGIRSAKSYGSNCIQVDMLSDLTTGVEDCLYLNVFKPKPQANVTKLLPVMFFIHGGYYVSGSGDLWRAKYLTDENVILVTINYRIGALGFLNTGTDLARGNMGLKDQVLALKWVQDNIESFGGDRNKVTILGQSAGAACVHFLMLSKMAKGLFHRAISMSGTILSAWAMTHTPQKQAVRFAKQLNCYKENAVEMTKCIKATPLADIMNVHWETTEELHEPLSIFKPSVESINDHDAFLAEHPYDILKNNSIPNKVPWIVGATKDDGLLIASVLLRNTTLMEEIQQDWQTKFPLTMLYNSSDSTVPEKIRHYYFGNDEKFVNSSNIKKFSRLFSDRQYFNGVHLSAIYHAKDSPVFGYVFSQPNELSLASVMFSIGEIFHPVVYMTTFLVQFWVNRLLFGIHPPQHGIGHVDDLSFLFNMPVFPQFHASNENYAFSVKLVKLWTSFADRGVPDSIDGLQWPQINSYDEYPEYLNLCNQTTILKGPYTAAVKFWNSLNITDR